MGAVEDVEIIDCANEHAFEVYANLTVPDDVEFSDVELFALDGCYEAFEPYVGVAYEESVYEFTWLEPTVESWEGRGDRTVNCLVYEAAASVGSAQGSSR